MRADLGGLHRALPRPGKPLWRRDLQAHQKPERRLHVMGLIARLHARLRHRHYVWSWRMRYWWLDTSAGAQALIVVLQFIGLGIAALAPRPAGKPQESIIWWVVYVIVMLIAAAVSYAMRPK